MQYKLEIFNHRTGSRVINLYGPIPRVGELLLFDTKEEEEIKDFRVCDVVHKFDVAGNYAGVSAYINDGEIEGRINLEERL